MYATCPHCSLKVIVKEDNTCPHCKSKIFEVSEAKAPQDGKKIKMPLGVICAICIDGLVAILFATIVFQFEEFDELSFVFILASLFSLLGIVSILLRRKWSRKYNIGMQVILGSVGLCSTVFLVATKFLAGPGGIIILAVVIFQGWVTLGLIRSKRVIAYLDGVPYEE